MPFWRNDAEFAIWPLAIFYWIGPHSLTLLWLQDIGVVAAELIGFRWMCDLAPRCANRRTAAWLVTTGLILFVASPWLWWSLSFDFHMESVAMPFAVLLARDLASGRTRLWWWVAPVLSAGGPAAVYVLGIGAGGILSGRSYWRRGAALVGISVAYSAFIVLIGADHGAPLARHYGYLALGVSASYAHGRLASGAHLSTRQMAEGIIRNPLRIAEVLWQKRADVNAALLPGGAIGILFRPLAPLIAVGLLSAVLSTGWRFAQPLFQYLPVYLLVPVGTVAVLAWVARRHSRSARVCAVLLAAQALCWAGIWGPQVPVHWLRVSDPAAATLAEVRVPDTGVRRGRRLPGRPGTVLRAPRRPCPRSYVEDSGQRARRLVRDHSDSRNRTAVHGQLDGLHRPAGRSHARRPDRPRQRRLGLPLASASRPALGHRPRRRRRCACLGRGRGRRPRSPHRARPRLARRDHRARGLRLGRHQWLEPLGRYTTQIVLSATGPANVEVWDDNGKGMLLARRTIAGAAGLQVVTLPVDVTTAFRSRVYSGWGPFSAHFVPPVPGQRIEVRIWSPGGESVDVYRASLRRCRRDQP